MQTRRSVPQTQLQCTQGRPLRRARRTAGARTSSARMSCAMSVVLYARRRRRALLRPTPRLSSTSARTGGRPFSPARSRSSSCGPQQPSVHAKPARPHQPCSGPHSCLLVSQHAALPSLGAQRKLTCRCSAARWASKHRRVLTGHHRAQSAGHRNAKPVLSLAAAWAAAVDCKTDINFVYTRHRLRVLTHYQYHAGTLVVLLLQRICQGPAQARTAQVSPCKQSQEER